MLFVTNRALKQSKRSRVNREVSFNLNDNEPTASVFFCERADTSDPTDSYTEIGSQAFLDRLKKDPAEQILVYIHGFNNLPEPDIFPRAEKLQSLLDAAAPQLVRVVPLIWPCDDDFGIIKDYWDDQDSADQAAFGFARVLGKFLEWRAKQTEEDACYKRINLLCHSMGNRVLRLTLERWGRNYGGVPRAFRNVFMAAPDVANETLERGNPGQFIPDAARNVVVYFASDDFAMRASKISNVKNKVVTRRLGHTGPENMERVPRNVYAVDCDDLNNYYDSPKGHAYFLADPDGKEGSLLRHIRYSLQTGRVDADAMTRTRVLGRTYSPPAG